MKIILFDIDGTLILTDGAGMRALRRACTNILDLDMDRCCVRPDGKTDPAIIREMVLAAGGAAPVDGVLEEVYEYYLRYLEHELNSGTALQVLEGARELLEELAPRPDVLLGVATGNIERGARLKLVYAGLESFLLFGGFGSDSDDRTELIRIGIERADRFLNGVRPGRTIVIGDTPRDISHGKRAGAETVGVATGSYPVDELRETGADLVLADLSEKRPLFDFLELTSSGGGS